MWFFFFKFQYAAKLDKYHSLNHLQKVTGFSDFVKNIKWALDFIVVLIFCLGLLFTPSPFNLIRNVNVIQ